MDSKTHLMIGLAAGRDYDERLATDGSVYVSDDSGLTQRASRLGSGEKEREGGEGVYTKTR